MKKPDFTLNKIKYKIDKATFEKAVALYHAGKVTEVEEGIRSYNGVVLGTKPYRVFVEARNFMYAGCSCYLGQRDIYCKHMLALALYVVQQGKKLNSDDLVQVHEPKSSAQVREPDAEELKSLRAEISAAIRYIKPYTGPSRTWWANQNSLQEGCNRLSEIVTRIPVHRKSAELLVKTLLRLDKKLCTGGVDDSNGIVGGFIEQTVDVLQEYLRMEPECTKAFDLLHDADTTWGWEKRLVDKKKNYN